MGKPRGLPPSRVGFPASARRAFYGTIRIWSYSLSTGVYLPASPAVGSQSGSHQERGSCSWQGERECILVKHASAFTQANDLACNPQTLFRCQGTGERIALYKSDVNMVCSRYAKTTSKNNQTNGTRQGSDCCSQSVLWSLIRQRGRTLCIENGTPSYPAVPPTPAPNKDALTSPCLEGQGSYARYDNIALEARLRASPLLA
jgi:hypothetical protein